MLNMALAMLLLLGVAFMPTLANCVDLAVASTEEATMEATPHMGHIDVPHARRTAPPVDVDGVETEASMGFTVFPGRGCRKGAARPLPIQVSGYSTQLLPR